MWCWRDSLAFAAAASVIAAAGVLFQDAPARAESFRVNNVDRAERINMRKSPSNKSKIVAYIPPEGRLEGTGQCNARWCEVTYKDLSGWVFRKYLTPEPNHAEQPRAEQPAGRPGEAEKRAETAAPQPNDAETEKAVPSDLQDRTLRLAFPNGRPIPVYAFPSDRLPAAGRISPETGRWRISAPAGINSVMSDPARSLAGSPKTRSLRMERPKRLPPPAWSRPPRWRHPRVTRPKPPPPRPPCIRMPFPIFPARSRSNPTRSQGSPMMHRYV